MWLKKYYIFGDFPGGPVAKTPPSNAGGPGLIPGQGTRSHVPQLKILRAATKRSRVRQINPVYCNYK